MRRGDPNSCGTFPREGLALNGAGRQCTADACCMAPSRTLPSSTIVVVLGSFGGSCGFLRRILCIFAADFPKLCGFWRIFVFFHVLYEMLWFLYNFTLFFLDFANFCRFSAILWVFRNFTDFAKFCRLPSQIFSCLLIRGRIACGCCRSLWMSSCMSRMLTACAPTKSPIKRDLQHRGQQISKLTVIYCALYRAGLQCNSIMHNVYPALGVYCWDNFILFFLINKIK